jgi:hypothetical protein
MGGVTSALFRATVPLLTPDYPRFMQDVREAAMLQTVRVTNAMTHGAMQAINVSKLQKVCVSYKLYGGELKHFMVVS